MTTQDPIALEPLIVSEDGLRTLGIPFRRETLVRMTAAGRFPRKVPLGSRKGGYLVSEIRTWLAERVAARDAQTVQP
ncbi:MAG TPA: AlpA family phage regulatory protein [Aliidongia sp.]|nr:AlpA family phage regulatory protein [Aliidongia sp.]